MAQTHTTPMNDSQELSFTISAEAKYDFANPAFASTITQLPDKERAEAVQIFLKKRFVANKTLLEGLLQQKSEFSDEQRAQLLKYRLHNDRSLLASTPSIQDPVSSLIGKPSVARGADNDTTRLAASVKTATGTFDDVRK
jgi:hypothetical protein